MMISLRLLNSLPIVPLLRCHRGNVSSDTGFIRDFRPKTRSMSSWAEFVHVYVDVYAHKETSAERGINKASDMIRHFRRMT